MKPFIEFSLEFSYRTTIKKIQRELMSICPFDHLPRKITKLNSKKYSLKVFFPDTEYLENAYEKLEMKKVELADLLRERTTCQFVRNATIGITREPEYEKELIK